MRLGSIVCLCSVLVPAALAAQVGPGDSASLASTTLPLKGDRVVRFTTDEGTWLDLDLSPDGRTIVFDLLGDLYTMPATGGKATRITTGPGYDAQPRFSPNGKQIVFVSDRDGSENVWIANADGTSPKMITQGATSRYQSPEWTPDGMVVVSRGTGGYPSEFGSRRYDQRSYELVLIDLRGGSGLKLNLSNGSNFLGAAFGNDPRYLYVMAGTQTIGLSYGSWSIVVYDRKLGTTSARASQSGGAVRPVVSPDNRWLAYGSRYDAGEALHLVDLITGDDRILLKDVQRDEQESLPSRDLQPGSSFTPDSKSLIIYHRGGFSKVDLATGTETKIPFTADVELHLNPLVRHQYSLQDTTFVAQQIRGTSLSPDAKRAVFTVFNKLWILDLSTCREGPQTTTAGCAPRRLTDATGPASEYAPSWSPDGQWIVFSTWSDQVDDAGGDIHRIKANASGPARPERLTRVRAEYQRPIYSPDGKRIVAQRGSRQNKMSRGYGPHDLIWIPAAGGDATIIGPANGDAQFTTDTGRIWVSQGGSLSSMRWDGFDQRVEVKASGASQLWISPTGQQAIALGGPAPQLFAFTMPGVVGATVAIAAGAGAGVPARQVTTIAAAFPSWTADGRFYGYTLGRSLFVVDASADSAAPRRYDVNLVLPKDRPRGMVALRGARLITMKGDEVIANGDLVVTDNRITAIGAQGSVTIPAGARVIDVSGKTILPGYVDTHGHIGLAGSDPMGTDWKCLANAAYGVTTVRDPSTGVDVFGYLDGINAGDVICPRVWATGPALTDNQNITSLQDAKNIITRYHDFYGTNYIKQYGPGERKAREWLIIAAREKQMNVVTEPYMDVVKDVNDAVDGYQEMGHGWPIFPIYKDIVTLIAASKMVHTATLTTTFGGPTVYAEEYYYYRRGEEHDDPKLRRFTPHDQIDSRFLRRRNWYADNQFVFKQQAEGIKKMIDGGGLVAIGAHGNFQGLGYHWEMEMHAAGGVPAREILRSATINGAIAIGYDKELGSLEVGKLADLQVLDEDPSTDITKSVSIRYVMLNGRLYDANTMNQIWPRERALPKQWWWE